MQIVTSTIKEDIGTLDFVALHARVEDDWRDYCGMHWFRVSIGHFQLVVLTIVMFPSSVGHAGKAY